MWGFPSRTALEAHRPPGLSLQEFYTRGKQELLGAALRPQLPRAALQGSWNLISLAQASSAPVNVLSAFLAVFEFWLLFRIPPHRWLQRRVATQR